MDLLTFLTMESLLDPGPETNQANNLADYTIETYDLAQPSDSDKEHLFLTPKIYGLTCKSTQQRFTGKVCNSIVNEYQREVNAYNTLKPLNCPHILKLEANGPLDDSGYLILPRWQHRPFDMHLLRPFVKQVLFQLLQAIAIVHAAKLVHRDIKWSNLVWRYKDDNTPHIYLIDFGRTTSATEKDDYTPEAYRCPAEDVFRAGILFGEMLLGTIKFYDEFQEPYKQLNDYRKKKTNQDKLAGRRPFQKTDGPRSAQAIDSEASFESPVF